MTTEIKIVAIVIVLALGFVIGLVLLNVRLRQSSDFPVAPIALGLIPEEARSDSGALPTAPSLPGPGRTNKPADASPVHIFRIVRYGTTTEFDGGAGATGRPDRR